MDHRSHLKKEKTLDIYLQSYWQTWLKNCNSFLAVFVNQITLMHNDTIFTWPYKQIFYFCMWKNTKGQNITSFWHVLCIYRINVHAFLFFLALKTQSSELLVLVLMCKELRHCHSCLCNKKNQDKLKALDFSWPYLKTGLVGKSTILNPEIEKKIQRIIAKICLPGEVIVRPTI